MTESNDNNQLPKEDGQSKRIKKKKSNRFPASWPAPPDCDRPSCGEIGKALQQYGIGDPNGGFLNHASSGMKKGESTKHCPPNSVELGVGSWQLLHSMAAWYPDQPTSEDRQHMNSFIAALARFYPCTYCAQDFQENLKESPVKTESRKDLCMWLCEQHNIVNQKLGKPLFSCDMDNLDERWRKSKDPRCNR